MGSEVKDITDDLPFEIPDNWVWVHLPDIAHSELGKTLDKLKNTGTPYPYLCSLNVQWNHISLSKIKEAKFEKHEEEKYLLAKGDLLICEGGEVGRSAIWDKDQQMYYQNALHRVRFYCENNPYFFIKVIELYKAAKIIDEYSKGVTIKHLVQSALYALYFPLPPLAEQVRIVAEIEKFEPLIAEYNKLEQQATKLDEEIYDKLKKSILQYAIQGKLVPQDPNDEPASVLLERIRAEKKAKLGKKYVDSFIYKGDDNCYYEKVKDSLKEIPDEMPFDVPESWQWIRIDNLFQHNTGKALNSSNTKGILHPYITTSNVYWGHFNLDRVKEMPFTEDEFSKCSIVPGDLLVCEGGDVGRAAIWEKDILMCIQNHIHRLRAYHPVCTQFYYFAFFVYKIIGLIGGKGIGIQGLSSGALGKLIFPLPPLAEQERIVKQVEIILERLKDEG